MLSESAANFVKKIVSFFFKVFLSKVKFVHMPPPGTVEERYDTSQKEVQEWLRKIIKGIETEEITFPILVHCNHGRDR